MITHRILKHLLILLALMLLISLTGCTPNIPYHVKPRTADNCLNAPDTPACYEAYYQEHEGFDLAFAEYSDRGNAFSDIYIDDVLKTIEDKANKEGVVLVVFVHGWKHNAKETDPNLVDFKMALKAVNDNLKESFGDTPFGRRQLIGLYIGWRGASITLPWVEQLTFWDRKAVAEEVGEGGVNRLLLELDNITHNKAENVLVVVGHSFGGAIVVGALNEVLTERAVQRTSRSHYSKTIGDGVLVLNPAIEANQLLSFVEAAIQDDYRREQHPLFISLSSDADSATHYAFPIGQTFGLLLTWHQNDLERSYYFDRLHPDTQLPLKEEHLDATTVGNFAPFLTHRLTALTAGDNTSFQVIPCNEKPEECRPRGLTSLGGLPTIRNLPENYPLFFYKTDSTVMKGHNDIFNQRVRAFVLTIVDDVVRRSLTNISPASSKADVTAVPEPSILGNPKEFEKRLQFILREMPHPK